MSDLTLIYGIKDVDVETFDEMFHDDPFGD